MNTESSRVQQRAIAEGRDRIARGNRPTYHAVVTTSPDGGADVRVRELPLVHLFAPADARVVDAARVLIARTLGVQPDEFDVEVAPAGTADGQGSPALNDPVRRPPCPRR